MAHIKNIFYPKIRSSMHNIPIKGKPITHITISHELIKFALNLHRENALRGIDTVINKVDAKYYDSRSYPIISSNSSILILNNKVSLSKEEVSCFHSIFISLLVNNNLYFSYAYEVKKLPDPIDLNDVKVEKDKIIAYFERVKRKEGYRIELEFPILEIKYGIHLRMKGKSNILRNLFSI